MNFLEQVEQVFDRVLPTVSTVALEDFKGHAGNNGDIWRDMIGMNKLLDLHPDLCCY